MPERTPPTAPSAGPRRARGAARGSAEAAELATLAAVARVANADLELRPMLQRITAELADRFGWDLVALVRIEPQPPPGRFVCEAVTARLPTVVEPGYSRPLGSGVVGRVAATGQAIELAEVGEDPGFVATTRGVRSELCVPVRHAGEMVAILNVESARPCEFRGRLPLFEAVADQIAGAIASARHLEETRRRAAHLALLSEVSRLAVEEGDLVRVLAGIATVVRQHFDLSLVAIVVANARGTEWEHRAFAMRDAGPDPVRPVWPVSAGVVGRAIRSGELQMVPDVRADPDYFAVDPRIVAEACVPIRFAGRTLGAINFENDHAEVFSPSNLELMRMLADQVAGAIQLALVNARLVDARRELEEANRRLRSANASLERASRVDALTAVANRRQFDDSLNLEWRRLARVAQPLSLLMVDVDHFKAYNDSHGHPRGDTCLRLVASALASCCQRAGELVARYGGEEFAVILPEIAGPEAVRVAGTIRERVRGLAIPHRYSPVSPLLTVSIGVASCTPRRADAPRTLVEAADRALYAAKAAGRDRVECDGGDPVAE